MECSDEDIILLRALHSLLMTSFRGASFGSLKVNDMAAALERVIDEAERTP